MIDTVGDAMSFNENWLKEPGITAYTLLRSFPTINAGPRSGSRAYPKGLY